MLQTTNFNQANVCALYNKGVKVCAVALDSLTSNIEKKIANYLVVPNICILSLSLSLSSRADVNYTFFLLAYARAKRAVTPVNKGLLEVSFVRFFMPFLKTAKTQNIELNSRIKSNLRNATEHQEEEIIHCFNNSSYAFVPPLELCDMK